MNPELRKVAFIAASLGLLLSLFLVLRPQDDDPPTTNAAAATETHATTTAPKPPQARPSARIRIDVGDGRSVGIRRLTVEHGGNVVLAVAADVTDHVHLHGYDLMAEVAPSLPARLVFTAIVPGRFEVELEDLGVQLAELTVEP